jgi:hypothetical protein
VKKSQVMTTQKSYKEELEVHPKGIEGIWNVNKCVIIAKKVPE